MKQDERSQVQSKSFGEVAENYDRYRPGPPGDAVEWLLPANATDVLDVGAGTGGLTRQLVTRVPHVRAVEPDARMREVLEERLAGVEVMDGRGEEIPADDASFDAVFMSSAWHWVDEERAVPEMARVLRPGGRLALLWSGPDRSIDWVKSLFWGGMPVTAEVDEAWRATRRTRHEVNLGENSPFGEPEAKLFHWTIPMSRDEALGLVGTFSVAITMDGEQREHYETGISDFLRQEVSVSADGTFEMPMRCISWRANLR